MKSSTAHPHENPHHPHWPLAGLLFLFIFLLGFFSVHETSTWINIKSGERILSTGVIPRVEPFSYSISEKSWSTVSWVSDVIFYRLDARFGPPGLIFFKALVAALAFALLLPLSPASPVMAAAVLSLGGLAAWAGFTETPAIFDLLMAVLFIRLLRPRRKFQWAWVPSAMILELLWVNLHGTSAVLGIWFVTLKLIKTALRSEPGERYGYPLMLGGVAAAFLVSPQGWEIVPRLFGPPLYSLPHWQVPLEGLFGLLGALGAAACWICLQQEFFLSVAAASLIGLSLLFPSLRPLALLCSCPVITLALGHFIRPWNDTLVRVARLALVMGGLFGMNWSLHYAPLSRSRGYGSLNLAGVNEYLKANGIVGRMFNEADAGDALIGGGDRPVFIDGRAGLYGPAFMKDAASWSARWAQLDGIYGFDYAVVLNRRAAYPARALDIEPWRLVYADDAALVYVKKSGANAWLVPGGSRPALEPNRLWPDAMDGALADPRRAAKLLEELDHWIVQSPDCVQALLWKAYALDRLKLAEKAQRLLFLAESRRRTASNPELAALRGFVLERRGQKDEAQQAYRKVAQLSRRLGDRLLESAVLSRLAPLSKAAGQEWEARGFEDRIRELAAAPPEGS